MNFSNHNFQTDEDILKDIELGNEKMKSKPKEKSKVSNYVHRSRLKSHILHIKAIISYLMF